MDAVTGVVNAGAVAEVAAAVGADVEVYVVAVGVGEDVARDVEVGCDVLEAVEVDDGEVKAVAAAVAVAVAVGVELVLMPKVGEYPGATVVEKYFAAVH